MHPDCSNFQPGTYHTQPSYRWERTILPHMQEAECYPPGSKCPPDMVRQWSIPEIRNKQIRFQIAVEFHKHFLMHCRFGLGNQTKNRFLQNPQPVQQKYIQLLEQPRWSCLCSRSRLNITQWGWLIQLLHSMNRHHKIRNHQGNRTAFGCCSTLVSTGSVCLYLLGING